MRTRQMNYRRLHFAILLIALCGAAAFAQEQPRTAARVWEAPLALPTYKLGPPDPNPPLFDRSRTRGRPRSEEHTSELQSRGHLVCRLLLEKKKHHHNH